MFLISIGILANGLVVWTVVWEKNLRNPTFVAIANLAIADICFLVSYFAANELGCPESAPSYATGKAFIVAAYLMMWFIASLHILLLSVIRFLLILHPLTSMAWITIRRTISMSIFIWSIGTLLGIIVVVVFVLEELDIADDHSTTVVFITIICGSYFIPLVATGILHILKLKEVRKALRSDLPAQVRQMAMMVAITLILFTILPLPQVVTLFMISFDCDVRFLEIYGVEWALSLGLLINSCSNPFVYAIFSRTFRRSLAKRFYWWNAHKSVLYGHYSSTHGTHTEESYMR